MTSGVIPRDKAVPRARTAHRCGRSAALLLALTLDCEALELAQLLPLVKQESTATLRYQEARTPAALKTPLRRTGRLAFVPPATLHQWVETPAPLHMTIEGDWLTVEDPLHGESTRIPLGEVPALEQLTHGLLGLLTGNARSIESHFRVGIQGTPENWHLTLTPRAAKPSDPSRLLINGQGAKLTDLHLMDEDGTLTVLQLATPQ